MKLFKTTSRRTSYRPRRSGYSTTLKAKTRLKRWFKRGTKKLWRTAKQRTKARIRRRWNRTRWATNKRQIARNAQQFRRHHAKVRSRPNRGFDGDTMKLLSYQSGASQPTGSYQATASGDASYQPGAAGPVEGKAQLPPPDGAIASCRRCAYEVQYSDAHGRWEHTGKGDYECFQPHRS